MKKIRTKCELCKCLNLIVEGKKHPSQTVWNTLTSKYRRITSKDPAVLKTICEYHRSPMTLIYDLRSVDDFISGVFSAVERLVMESIK